RELEAPQDGGEGSTVDLYGCQARGGGACAHGVRRALARSDALHQPAVARELGEPEPVLRLPAADPEGDLHDERDRIDPGATQERHEEARRLSNARVSAQGPVHGPDPSERALDHADLRQA